jgi:hypothetical protein
MLQNAKRRAAAFGIPFDLSLSDLVIPEVCPVLGILLQKGEGRSCDASPSLDRIRPALGYVRGNVAIISQRANQIKNSATVGELLAVADWLERQQL